MEQMCDHTKSRLLLGEPTAQANEIEIFLDGGVGQKGRIKIDGRIWLVKFRKHY